MATKVITTRCTNCPTIIETVPLVDDGTFDEQIKGKRFIMGERYKGMKCPKCDFGTLTITSYSIPGELKTGSQIAEHQKALNETANQAIDTTARSLNPPITQSDLDKMKEDSAKREESAKEVRMELETEIEVTRRAMDWLTEKGKTESVLFRAADSYLITLNQQLEEL